MTPSAPSLIPSTPFWDESAELKLSSTETGLDPDAMELEATLAQSSRSGDESRQRELPDPATATSLSSTDPAQQLSDEAPSKAAASAAFCAARRLRRAFFVLRLLPFRLFAPWR